MIGIAALDRVNWCTRGSGLGTHNRILILSVYVGRDDTHRSGTFRTSYSQPGIAHSLAGRNPNIQTFGVVQELSKKLEELCYMRLERIHNLFQDSEQDKDTDLALGGSGGGHG